MYHITVATRSNFMNTTTTLLPYNIHYNNCSNTLCYTYSKNYIYKPHSAVGMVGTISSSSRARRKQI
jgi:hypothetical protein